MGWKNITIRKNAVVGVVNIDCINTVLGTIKSSEGIDFYCGGKGIAPSSQDYGFYYTEDDLPKAIWCGVKYCDDSFLVEDGDGYSTDYQHNYYYTEKIRDNFYYYEARF